jgi:hypothetical protein
MAAKSALLNPNCLYQFIDRSLGNSKSDLYLPKNGSYYKTN